MLVWFTLNMIVKFWAQVFLSSSSHHCLEKTTLSPQKGKNISSLSVLQSLDEVSDWVSTAVAAKRATTTLTYLLWIQVRLRIIHQDYRQGNILVVINNSGV